MVSKKGSIEIQFNWIFVVIAGGLIFLFFFTIINVAQKNAAESSAATISNYLDATLTSSSVRKETFNQIKLPFKKIEFTCSYFRVDDSKNTRNIRNKLIFAPSKIEKGELLSWSISWDSPFRVTNFLLLSSPNIRYIIYGDETNEYFEYIKKNIPEEFNVEFNPSEVNDNNHPKVRFIYIDKEVQNNYVKEFNKMDATDVTALKVTTSTSSISFYKKTPPTSESSTIFVPWNPSTDYFFLGKSSLVAAMISENPEDYQCNMNGALARLTNIAEIYKKRSEQLKSYYSSSNDMACQSVHDLPFDELISASKTLNYATILTVSEEISEKNQEAQVNSCELIY